MYEAFDNLRPAVAATGQRRVSRWHFLSLGTLLMVGAVGCSGNDPASPAAGGSGEPTTEPTVSENDTSAAGSTEVAADPVDRTGQVLRHAVFFSFKEDSTPEQVLGVAKKFASLEDSIDLISDFEWGTNNSPEGFDDGFTHCFLVSFETAADRDGYIPHPEHAGGFADVLRPHMKDVFVFDYWGTPPATPIENPVRHAVFFKFKDDAAEADVKKVEAEFAALADKIDTIKAFEWGLNNSPENKADGFTHCFLVTFASEKDRDEYLPNPDHQAFVEILTPVLDKVRVLDFVPEP